MKMREKGGEKEKEEEGVWVTSGLRAGRRRKEGEGAEVSRRDLN